MFFLIIGFLFLLLALYVLLIMKRFTNVVLPVREEESQARRYGRLGLLLGLTLAVVIIASGWKYGVAFFLQAGMFSLLLEPVNWIVKLISKATKSAEKKWYRIYRKIFCLSLLTVVLAGAFTAWGAHHIRDVKKTEYTVTSADLAEDMKVVMISDLHYPLVMTTERLQGIADEIAAQKPDLLLLAGDICDENTTKEQMEEAFRILGAIPTQYGCYYVYGNHDNQQYLKNKKYTLEEMEHALSESNVTALVDEHVTIRDDLELYGRQDRSYVRKSVEDLLKGSDPSRFHLVMDHQPQEYALESKFGADLVVSGHTHDGQLFPCGYFITIFHMADLTVGTKMFGDMDAIVSSGIVGWGFPIRTQGNSEYVVIHLQAK